MPRTIITLVLRHIKAVWEPKAPEWCVSSPLIILHKIISLGCHGVCPGKWKTHCSFQIHLLNTHRRPGLLSVSLFPSVRKCMQVADLLWRGQTGGAWVSAGGSTGLAVSVYDCNSPLILHRQMLFRYVINLVF